MRSFGVMKDKPDIGGSEKELSEDEFTELSGMFNT